MGQYALSMRLLNNFASRVLPGYRVAFDYKNKRMKTEKLSGFCLIAVYFILA